MKTGLASVGMFCLLLAGCSPFKSNQPPTTYYLLRGAAAPGSASTGMTVGVAEPAVPPGFESDKIAVFLQQERRMDYAAGAAWPAPFPKVLQDFIVQSGSSMPGISAVTADSGVPFDRTLLVKVTDFEPVYAADAKSAPGLKVAMTFTLVEGSRVRMNFSRSATGQASQNSLTAITSGLEGLARPMVADAFREIKPAPRKHRQKFERHITTGPQISSTTF